jgi:hypothetical protein
LINGFKDEVRGQIEVTKGDIRATHAEFVQCQLDDHCCETGDSTIENWWIEINNFTRKMNELKKERLVIGYKIQEVEKECPQYISGLDLSI